MAQYNLARGSEVVREDPLHLVSASDDEKESAIARVDAALNMLSLKQLASIIDDNEWDVSCATADELAALTSSGHADISEFNDIINGLKTKDELDTHSLRSLSHILAKVNTPCLAYAYAFKVLQTGDIVASQVLEIFHASLMDILTPSLMYMLIFHAITQPTPLPKTCVLLLNPHNVDNGLRDLAERYPIQVNQEHDQDAQEYLDTLFFAAVASPTRGAISTLKAASIMAPGNRCAQLITMACIVLEDDTQELTATALSSRIFDFLRGAFASGKAYAAFFEDLSIALLSHIEGGATAAPFLQVFEQAVEMANALDKEDSPFDQIGQKVMQAIDDPQFPPDVRDQARRIASSIQS